MGNYVDATALQAFASSFFDTAFDGTTDPSLTTVNTIIADVEAEVDAAFTANNVTTPLTGDDISAIRRYVLAGCAHEAWRESGYSLNGYGQTDMPSRWLSTYEKFLDNVRRGSFPLPSDAVGTQGRRRRLLVSSPKRE